MKHVCSIITWWYTDAAAEELSAGEMLTGSAAARQLFPNLKVIGCEQAHTSRRVLERPQKAEPYLEEVARHFLWNMDSIASLFQHSDGSRGIFQAASRELDEAQNINRLRFRRHRFDSQAEPLSRMSVAFDALLQSASQISHARRNEDAGKQAANFLQWITDESALQMAMLADASDQVLTLVRKQDADCPDPALHASFVKAFILEGTRYWLENHCWPNGCTNIMMRGRAKPRVYLIGGGSLGALEIGGRCDDALKERCLGRMRCWFRLAIDVCHAEFPYFEIIHSFQVFNLHDAPIDGGCQPDDDDGTGASVSLERLANVWWSQCNYSVRAISSASANCSLGEAGAG